MLVAVCAYSCISRSAWSTYIGPSHVHVPKVTEKYNLDDRH